MRSRRRWLVLATVLVLGLSAWLGRRVLIRDLFTDGGDVVALPPAGAGVGLTRVARTRVLLVDGLSAAAADELPALTRSCGSGLRLTVDVGFPTVSLPVQHVLWTGLTQQQAGVQYRIPRLSAPPGPALPARVPDSVGIAESHADIVGSFGFSTARPADDVDPWAEAEFVTAATAAVQSDAALVFVHVLRVDEAGHAHGGASPEYARAARWADDRIAEWIADPPPDVRWFVLSDHGHLPGGGHGDAEPAIRLVRACIVGNLPADFPPDGSLLLVDLARALADSTGLAPDDLASGRPLAAALSEPALGSTLPRPSPARWLVAALAVGLGLGIAFAAAPRRVLGLPWWPALGYAGVFVWHGLPSLSSPPVYPPWGLSLLLAAAPGFVALGVLARLGAREASLPRSAVAQLAPGLGIALATAVMCGLPQRWFGLSAGPPLVPWWTAHASVAFSLCLGAALTMAVVALGYRGRPDP
jgi:hypothetical protein